MCDWSSQKASLELYHQQIENAICQEIISFLQLCRKKNFIRFLHVKICYTFKTCRVMQKKTSGRLHAKIRYMFKISKDNTRFSFHIPQTFVGLRIMIEVINLSKFQLVGWLLVLRPIVSLGTSACRWSVLHGGLSKVF